MSKTMSRVLGGYAVAFNLRHGRSGHLFQNRFKSTVVDDERYLLALVRYVHLNPLRAGIVGSLEELSSYPWCGHGALMGKAAADFLEADEVLSRFGNVAGEARRELTAFMGHPDAKKDEAVFKGAGGGLVRSLWGMSSIREGGKREKTLYDERVLGSGSSSIGC